MARPAERLGGAGQTGLRWRRASDVLWRSASFGAVVLDADGEAHRLVPPGDLCWELFDEPRSFDEVVALVAADAGLPPEHIRTDVTAYLDELVARHLIEPDG